MTPDVETAELIAAMNTVVQARRLLGEAREMLGGTGVSRDQDQWTTAGSAVQTLQGADDMHRGSGQFLEDLALALGYATAGLADQAHRRRERARQGFIGLGGGDRMARPLPKPTVEALELLRGLDLLTSEFRDRITEVLEAEAATYPAPAPVRTPRLGSSGLTPAAG
ncbi:hypothetical protein MTF65_04010 [Streptomyces sp. APSN-46.1]|uniref:hypothetical protein n=1 Tax=Streptomyces sp. APSN-46.1 TaxID=2929049 RepID=UPI001FB22E14|nr:hypothetical protein [Streptomyces sp. APSN-46.1]MCJ1676525.1 hypothetical protein [Streptomyces sp. APSN-46.1]